MKGKLAKNVSKNFVRVNETEKNVSGFFGWAGQKNVQVFLERLIVREKNGEVVRGENDKKCVLEKIGVRPEKWEKSKNVD